MSESEQNSTLPGGAAGKKKGSFFDQLSPKSAVIVGLVGGVLILCAIGFFIMLGLYFKGNASASNGGNNAVAAANQPSTAPSAQGANQAAAPGQPVNVGVGHFPALGKSTAPVTVVEFADFRCPYCERFFQDAESNIIKDYVNTGKVKFYFRSFAFLGPESTVASEAAECANEQGQFWKFHDWLYSNQAPESDTTYYSKDNLIKYAANLGLNKTQFASCLNSDKYASAVQQDLSDGEAAGVNGTPTTFINGTPLVGAQPYSAVKAAIDQALQGK